MLRLTLWVYIVQSKPEPSVYDDVHLRPMVRFAAWTSFEGRCNMLVTPDNIVYNSARLMKSDVTDELRKYRILKNSTRYIAFLKHIQRNRGV